MAHKNHGITLWPRKIKKCDPKRLEATRHARHDKTFTCCYFLQHVTKKKTIGEITPPTTQRRNEKCASVCDAFSRSDLLTGCDRRRPQPEPSSRAVDGLGCLTVSFARPACVYVCVSRCLCAMKGLRSSSKPPWSRIINI